MRLWPSCHNQWTMITMCPTTVHYMLVPPRFIGFDERHFPFPWYSWGVQWVAGGTWTAAWSRRDASWSMQGKGIYQVYTDSILVIWRLHSIFIPTLFLSYDDFIPSIYRLYSFHMTASFHLYTNSILVIWRLHSIYILTLFFWASEGCGATLAA